MLKPKLTIGKFDIYEKNRLPTDGHNFLRIELEHLKSNIIIPLFHNRALQDSADRLFDSFQALGPEGGFLPPNVAKEVLLKTGLGKEQLRQIWNLSDIDRDGYLDHHEYVVAMFLCDAVIQKKKPIPAELPATVVPPSKKALLSARKAEGY